MLAVAIIFFETIPMGSFSFKLDAILESFHWDCGFITDLTTIVLYMFFVNVASLTWLLDWILPPAALLVCPHVRISKRSRRLSPWFQECILSRNLTQTVFVMHPASHLGWGTVIHRKTIQNARTKLNIMLSELSYDCSGFHGQVADQIWWTRRRVKTMLEVLSYTITNRKQKWLWHSKSQVYSHSVKLIPGLW